MIAPREIAPEELADRAQLWKERALNALMVPDAGVSAIAARFRAACTMKNIDSMQAELESYLSGGVRAESQGILVVTSESTDKELWTLVDQRRSRLEARVTVLVLSSDAMESLNRFAPHLASVLSGRQWLADANDGSDTSGRLFDLIESAARFRYPELYEGDDERESGSLDETVHNIVELMGDPVADAQAHRRLGFVSRAILLEVMPTIEGHWPQGAHRANTVLGALDAWLDGGSTRAVPESPADVGAPKAPQAITEAASVVDAAILVVKDRARAREAVEDMLDACFQGYAIVPGSSQRRVLLDWWLQDVVPAAWSLRSPTRLDRTRL